MVAMRVSGATRSALTAIHRSLCHGTCSELLTKKKRKLVWGYGVIEAKGQVTCWGAVESKTAVNANRLW